MDNRRNIVLIGMPGVGKSTLGVLLAKRLGYDFIDTDVYLQARAGRSLQQIIDRDGVEVFRSLEAAVICSLQCNKTVIATGGSAVYSRTAIAHLRQHGHMLHLHVPMPALEQRLGDFEQRGVVRAPGQTLAQLYAERAPLYAQAADQTIDCAGKTHEQIVALIVASIS